MYASMLRSTWARAWPMPASAFSGVSTSNSVTSVVKLENVWDPVLRLSEEDVLLNHPAPLEILSHLSHECIDQLAVRGLRIGGVEDVVMTSEHADGAERSGGAGGAAPDRRT